jgi:hypothetical protein
LTTESSFKTMIITTFILNDSDQPGLALLTHDLGLVLGRPSSRVLKLL